MKLKFDYEENYVRGMVQYLQRECVPDRTIRNLLGVEFEAEGKIITKYTIKYPDMMPTSYPVLVVGSINSEIGIAWLFVYPKDFE